VDDALTAAALLRTVPVYIKLHEGEGFIKDKEDK
jgi:hypothetical protein